MIEQRTYRANDSRFSPINTLIAMFLRIAEGYGVIAIMAAIIYSAVVGFKWMNIAYFTMGAGFACCGLIILCIAIGEYTKYHKLSQEVAKEKQEAEHNKRLSKLGLEELRIEKMKINPAPQRKPIEGLETETPEDDKVKVEDVLQMLDDYWEGGNHTLSFWKQVLKMDMVKMYGQAKGKALNYRKRAADLENNGRRERTNHDMNDTQEAIKNIRLVRS